MAFTNGQGVRFATGGPIMLVTASSGGVTTVTANHGKGVTPNVSHADGALKAAGG